MQYVNLGRTALKVSRLCLGTMNFGPLTSEQDSYAIMDRALELGINFFDTANVYGWKKGEGVTEQIIGRWWAQGGGRRDKVVIATKVYGDMGDWPNTSRLSKLHMRKALDDSLRRLKTDFIDLYQFHHIWREATWDEIWEFCEWAHAAGKVLYFGSSNFAGWHIVQANEAAKRRNFLGLVSEQSIYHLLRRQIEMEVMPACAAYGVGIIPWSPLGGGLLGGVLQKLSEGRRASEGMQQQVEAHREKLEAWENLCRELGEKPANVAIAWMLQNPVITAPIIGPRTIEQLNDIVRALEIKLDEETNKRIEAIFPGYKTAPEEYAW
ncbi:MAG TPA: aldo/keto reductase [Chthonomonas sp.]|jgi:aryl-alcohol dehydrogenase-like predicted oxidoreductase|uniref:aldo/keto reductase n=1 Tax=Chthonomonas sp. TaxID=2282153 RepID=UPI002B4AF410|nr:aldo/keto reductase [Chthonomonas sp.]HLH79872.1 aldo/keto reductase [Chthonomonas sp.]HLI48542.1 aldo/keto reductase [Chthonomonas sp.]